MSTIEDIKANCVAIINMSDPLDTPAERATIAAIEWAEKMSAHSPSSSLIGRGLLSEIQAAWEGNK